MGKIITQHLNCCSTDDSKINGGFHEVNLMNDYPFCTPKKSIGGNWNNVTQVESPTQYPDDSFADMYESSEEEAFAVASFGITPEKVKGSDGK